MKQNRKNTQQIALATPNFTGYGPAGWSRGDEFIEDDICGRLYRDRSLDATGIQVEVSDGNVTLSGYVPTERTRQTAMGLCNGIPGVKQLNNHLAIAAPTGVGAGTEKTAPQTAGRSSRA